MKKSLLIILSLTLVQVACSKKKKEPVTVAVEGGSAGGSGRAGGGDSSGAGLHTSVLEKVHCENPIPLEDPQMEATEEETPKGKWNLIAMDFYMLQQDSNESYYVTANSEKDFQPNIDCNGLSDLTGDNYSRSYTDANGAYHKDTKGADSNTSASFTVAEWIDAANYKASPKSRTVEVKFNKNQLISAKTLLEKNGITDTKNSLRGNLDRLEVAPDTFVSFRKYFISDDHLELRVKFEHKADEDEKRMIQYSRAVYQLEK